MHVYVHITRSKPEFPRVLKIGDKTVFISRVYTEAPAINEEPGWNDWTTETQSYYKFKYTPRYGQRVVFIIPKTVQLSLEEFSKAVEKTKWFGALKKWATIGYRYFKTNDITDLVVQLRNTVFKLLTKYEIWCVGDQVINFIDSIPDMIRRLEGKISVSPSGNLGFNFEHEFKCGAHACTLPFTIGVNISMTFKEFTEIDTSGLWYTIPIRDYLRLILELMKNPRFIDFSKTPNRAVSLRHLETVIKELSKRRQLREDYGEKIVLWLRYHRHFRTTLD